MKFNIYNNEKKINTIVSSEEFCKKYCNANGYNYSIVDEPQEEQITLTREDEIDALLIEQEYRLTLLESGVVNNAM